MMKKVIGIIGGMGPEAGCYFHQQIIRNTPVKVDQNHLEVILHTNPRIPDRTAAILSGGESPVAEINRSIQILEGAGANVITMACITAHFFWKQLRSSQNTVLLNLIDISAAYLKNNYPKTVKVGVLATTGTFQSGLLDSSYQKFGFELIIPAAVEQRELVMEAIYGVDGIKRGYKEGNPKEKLLQAVSSIKNRGAEIILAACTEIPLVLNQTNVNMPFFDILEIGAKYLVEYRQ